MIYGIFNLIWMIVGFVGFKSLLGYRDDSLEIFKVLIVILFVFRF